MNFKNKLSLLICAMTASLANASVIVNSANYSLISPFAINGWPADSAGVLTNDGSGGLSWGAGGGGGGVTTVGTFTSSGSNGLVISGSSIAMIAATFNHPGGVSTGTQIFAGEKSFTNKIIPGASGISTADAAGGPTQDLILSSGNSTPGDSGGVFLKVGTAGGTQGDFKFLKIGVAPTPGDIWTNTNADGSGYWSTPSFSNLSLSNVSSVAFGDSFVFGAGVTGVIATADTDGSSGAKNLNLTGGSLSGSGNFHPGNINITGGTGFDHNGGSLTFTSGPSENADSGLVSISSPDATGSRNSGSIGIGSGGVEDGIPGDVAFNIGGVSGSGTNGHFKFIDSSIGQIGDTITSIDDQGSTLWKHTSNAEFFGDGSDGAIDLDGVNTYAFMLKLDGDYYPLRQIYATNLTVRAGMRLIPSAYSIFGTGTLTIEATGEINASAEVGDGAFPPDPGGHDGQGVGGLNGDSGYLHPSGYLTQGDISPGNTSQSGAGATHTDPIAATCAGGFGVLLEANGGISGAGGNGSAGTGGTAPALNAGGKIHYRKVTTSLVMAHSGEFGNNTFVNGGQAGCGGAAGGGDGTNNGGGGGAGGGTGGVVALFFDTIVNDGTIKSNGAAGADGETPATVVPVTGGVGGGGGGGGGSGGLIYMISRTGATGATSVTGGAGGVGGVGQGTDHTDGANGSSGGSGKVLHYQLSTGVWL